EWARGKCSLKLLQYMSAGLATVSSPRGSVADIVHDGENGFVAATEADWVARLGALVDDAALRARVGARAREWLVSHYSLEHWGPRFVAVLRAAARGEDVRDA
ncbi:MAG TPA: glycosyltransferase, partial [Candidatus Krumholzibacteria bacterium]|nr:glycosyltransferase [Candidatus Krumholzibacteria bacterium]